MGLMVIEAKEDERVTKVTLNGPIKIRMANFQFFPCSFEDMRWVPAKYKDEAFLREVSLASQRTEEVRLWWLGQSGFLLQWNHIHVLIDPYLSDSLTKKYEGTEKPHIRMCDRVIAPGKLTFIDIVTSSHNHTDHLDTETLIPLINANPGISFIIPEANREFVTQRIKKPADFPIGLNDNQSVDIKGIRFTGVPAAHNELDRDDMGRCRYMGYIIEIGGKKIYHSGDTLLFNGMPGFLAPFEVDLALLPINGSDPSRGVAGNLNSEEAVWLAKSIGAKLTIPCHYDMFTFNTADVSVFKTAADQNGLNNVVLTPGESLTI
jgi:L-ascorbate metabolism protein UlaG (beta-lactamase superfamily)